MPQVRVHTFGLVFEVSPLEGTLAPRTMPSNNLTLVGVLNDGSNNVFAFAPAFRESSKRQSRLH